MDRKESVNIIPVSSSTQEMSSSADEGGGDFLLTWIRSVKSNG